MEPRWIKQTDTYSCGPIALANILKWAGIQSNWSEDRDDFRKLCRTNAQFGTQPANLTRALRTWGSQLIIVKRSRWKLAEIIDHVEGRGAVIFDFTVPLPSNVKKPWWQRDGHYAACVDIMGEGGNEWFKFINLESHETVTWVHRSWFKRLFMKGRKGEAIWKIRLRK